MRSAITYKKLFSSNTTSGLLLQQELGELDILERMEKMKSEQERQGKENYRRKKLREGHERKQVGLEQFRAVF